MRAREAKRHAIEWLEDDGWVVYDQLVQRGLPAMGQIVIADPNSGGTLLVRVMTGKRPPRSKRLLHDTRREGLCDALAVVDPRDGSVRLKAPASLAEAPIAA